MMTLEAGDIVILDFPGAIQTKRRPAVVLSSATYHESRPDIIVGLITSRAAAAVGPTDHVLDDWRTCGLRAPSAFRAFLATLPASTARRKVGRLSERDWQAVRSRLTVALAALPAGTP